MAKSRWLRLGAGKGSGAQSRRRANGDAEKTPSNPRGWPDRSSEADLQERPHREISLNDEQDHWFCNNFVRTSKVSEAIVLGVVACRKWAGGGGVGWMTSVYRGERPCFYHSSRVRAPRSCRCGIVSRRQLVRKEVETRIVTIDILKIRPNFTPVFRGGGGARREASLPLAVRQMVYPGFDRQTPITDATGRRSL